MNHFRTMLIITCTLAITAGCAKKNLVVQDPAAGITKAPPAVTAEASTETKDVRQEPVVAQAVTEENRPAPAAEVQPANPLQTVYFDFDSWLLSAQAREIAARNAAWLRTNPTAKIILEGHTDERGSDAYNMALGEQRAKSVLAYMKNLGISGDRMSVVSYGEEMPAVTGCDEAAWAKNRRVDFVPVKK